MITADTIVVDVNPADISPELFRQVQADKGSPATGEAEAAYKHLEIMDTSIAFLLAIFHHESQYATAPNAIVVTYDTHNPGNCRSSRTGDYPVIDTERGAFVDYPSWTAGWVDLSFRLTDPTYVYVQEGRRTIRQIIERFAPASDGNVPAAYINAVVKDMNAWIGTEAPVAGADIPGWAWIPEGCGEYGYDPSGSHGRGPYAAPDLLILHCTAGSDSLAWLNGCHGNSCHFVDWPDGTKRAQMIPLADAAWAAGNQEFNQRGINFEHEATPAQMNTAEYWTSTLVKRIATNCAEIVAHCPAILPDRSHIIGHNEVPDPDGSGYGGAGNHTDPGPYFPWTTFMQELLAALGGGDDVYRYFPETGQGIGHGFKDYWEQFHDDQRSIAVYGYPLSEELTDPATGLTVQYFERAIYEFHPENQDPYRVLLRRLGADAWTEAGEP